MQSINVLFHAINQSMLILLIFFSVNPLLIIYESFIQLVLAGDDGAGKMREQGGGIMNCRLCKGVIV